jgi:molecular chaperone GrpE (heat shock protein)
MIYSPKMLRISMLLMGSCALNPTAAKAQDETQSCTGQLTQQLRRFSEKCISDLVGYVASQPEMGARISSETENYHVELVKDAKGFRAEAVSKFNFPMVKDETIDSLKQLGWAPPENESDNWKKLIDADRVNIGALAEDLSKALAAYGLKKGEAISLTIGTDLSK